jgi:hypothetical protein
MLYVLNGDPGLLIENIKTMLSTLQENKGGKCVANSSTIEPGGYIHWEELDVEGMYVRSDKEKDTYPFCNKYIDRGLSWMKCQKINARYSIPSTSLVISLIPYL